MRVLSIDFDFFQILTLEQERKYPDGLERLPEQSVQEWRKCYNNSPDLWNIEINKKELDNLYKLLKMQNDDIPVMVSYSHADIMDLICEDDRYYEEDLYITNIDMHHDIWSDHDANHELARLDCGNWLSFVMKDKET